MHTRDMKIEIDIGELREQLGWTQEKLAEFLGVDRSTVSRMENGKSISGPVIRLLIQLKRNYKLPFRPEDPGEAGALEAQTQSSKTEAAE